MGKHTLKIEYDFDFVLIGISSHEKDYRLCWAINKALEIDLIKIDSLEIKQKKDNESSFFSLFHFENPDEFKEYFIVSNLSEDKQFVSKNLTLFNKQPQGAQSAENGVLIPEQKQMNYFFIIRGELDDVDVNEYIKKIKKIDFVLTALEIDAAGLKSKSNLVF